MRSHVKITFYKNSRRYDFKLIFDLLFIEFSEVLRVMYQAKSTWSRVAEEASF